MPRNPFLISIAEGAYKWWRSGFPEPEVWINIAFAAESTPVVEWSFIKNPVLPPSISPIETLSLLVPLKVPAPWKPISAISSVIPVEADIWISWVIRFCWPYQAPIPTGLSIRVVAEEDIYKWILYGVLLARKDTPGGVLASIKKERFAETRKAKIRLSNLKAEEITQILRGGSKIIKH